MFSFRERIPVKKISNKFSSLRGVHRGKNGPALRGRKRKGGGREIARWKEASWFTARWWFRPGSARRDTWIPDGNSPFSPWTSRCRWMGSGWAASRCRGCRAGWGQASRRGCWAWCSRCRRCSFFQEWIAATSGCSYPRGSPLCSRRAPLSPPPSSQGSVDLRIDAVISLVNPFSRYFARCSLRKGDGWLYVFLSLGNTKFQARNFSVNRGESSLRFPVGGGKKSILEADGIFMKVSKV